MSELFNMLNLLKMQKNGMFNTVTPALSRLIRVKAIQNTLKNLTLHKSLTNKISTIWKENSSLTPLTTSVADFATNWSLKLPFVEVS